MKILYAASEATPFAKSGGLADVAGALPKALVKDGVDARVIMPLYGDLKYRDKLEYVTNYSVPVGWRSQYCGLFKADVDGVTYYFLDNEYYFKRRGLYGFYDDGERFAFFSRAVLETLFYIDFTPDIINCNDWQTALVPVYLNLYYRHLDKFNRIKTVFTIHIRTYITLPKDNIETALWLEADPHDRTQTSRPKRSKPKKRVVIEEYKQRYLNQPTAIRECCCVRWPYTLHPYRWADRAYACRPWPRDDRGAPSTAAGTTLERHSVGLGRHRRKTGLRTG